MLGAASEIGFPSSTGSEEEEGPAFGDDMAKGERDHGNYVEAVAPGQSASNSLCFRVPGLAVLS